MATDLIDSPRCPRCGNALWSDGVRVWCSFTGSQCGSTKYPPCRFGMDEPVPAPAPEPPATPSGNQCQHESFAANVSVARITNAAGDVVERYQANVTIICDQCKMPFRFVGLPAGLDLNGAAVSVDGAEARLCIAPKGEVLSAMEGSPVGFSVKKVVCRGCQGTGVNVMGQSCVCTRRLLRPRD